MSGVKGRVVVENIHMPIPEQMTLDELNRIKQLLRNGVTINEYQE